jgi:FAD/FMN-containing dehydrogenase
MRKTMSDPARPMTRSNWNNSNTTRPAVEVNPRSVDDLVAIVRGTEEYPSPVRAVGHLHSTNPCFSTNGLNPGDPPGGTLVGMMQPEFQQIAIEISGTDVYVRAGAGARLIDIRNALRPLERELPVSPEIGNATIGSVACAGTKDATLKPFEAQDTSQISSAVVEVQYVAANGDRVCVDENGSAVIAPSTPGGPALRLPTLAELRSSYGLFGIVYEVKIKTVPLVPIETRYAWLPFAVDRESGSIQVPDLAAVFGGAGTVLGFLQPYHGGMLVERRTVRPGAAITIEDRMRRALRDWIWEWGASESTRAADAIARIETDPREALRIAIAASIECAVAGTVNNPVKRELIGVNRQTAERALSVLRGALGLPDYIPGPVANTVTRLFGAIRGAVPGGGPDVYNQLIKLLDYAPGIVFDAIRGFTAYRSDSMLDFVQPSGGRQTGFDFTFWLFPLSPSASDRDAGWKAIMADYFAFCGSRAGFRPSLFTQVYFMGQDRSSLLSPCPDGPAFSLDVAHTAGVRPQEWRDFNVAYNDWAVRWRGRPLLNQTKHLEVTPNANALMARAFPETWDRFTQLVAATDPQERFLSDFFRRLLR